MINIVKYSIQIASFIIVTTTSIAGALAETVYTEQTAQVITPYRSFTRAMVSSPLEEA